ncbi:hypothetical protein Tco_1129887, partial [Tanacetum coccineum]
HEEEESQPHEIDELFQDDTLIADILVNISRPRRGARITIPGNVPETERSESQTPVLDPKDKGKAIIKEEPKKKKLTPQDLRAAKIAFNEEAARRIQAELYEQEEKERLAGLERLQAKLEANEMIVEEMQRRRFRAEQQSALRRSRPPTIPQLRNQMIKYIRNVGGKFYGKLKNKNYEEVKVIYEKVKKYNETFTAIETPEDEEAIKEMNEKRDGIRRAQSTSEELPKESIVNKEPDSTFLDEGSKKRRASSRLKQIARKKRAKTEDVEELRKSLKIVDFLSDSLTDEEILSTRS